MAEDPIEHVPIDVRTHGHVSATPFRPGEMPLFIGGRVAPRRSMVTWIERVAAGHTTSALLVYGPRGTGKTTLTGFLADELGRTGWLPVPLRGDLGSRFVDQVAALASAERTMESTWKLGFDLKIVEASVERVTAGSGDPTLASVVADLAEHATNGVVLVVDEAQAADQPELAALSFVLEDVADRRQLPVGVALFGTEKLVDVIGPQHGSLGRLHRSEHVELPIGQTLAETTDICTGTLAEHAGISRPAVAAIQDDTGGFPHGIQVFGELAFEAASGRVIESSHVAEVRDEAYARLTRQVFQMMWRRQGSRGPAPVRTHEYLRHVAAGRDDLTHADVAVAIDLAPSSLSQIRHDLISRGVLVADEAGRLRFGIPLMRRYVDETER